MTRLMKEKQQQDVSQQRRLLTNNINAELLQSITTETLQLQYYNAGVLTNDAGQAAGTVVVGKLENSNVLTAEGDVVGNHNNTSFSFDTGTILTTLKEFPYLTAEEYDQNSGENRAIAVTNGFANGEYCIDHETGLIYGVKATTGTSDTVNYKIYQALAGSGGGAPASNVNVNQWGGSATTLGQKAMTASVPVVLASDQASIPVDTDVSSTILSGSKTVATAGVAEALAASTSSNRVVVQAKSTNTGTLLVGNAGSQDIELTAGDSVELSIDDLATVYLDVTVNGEGANYLGTA